MNPILTRRSTLAALSAAALPLHAAPPATLPPLPFPTDALEPFLDARTMEIHHSKHHQAYVDNLNKALSSHPQLAAKPLPDLLSNLSALPDSIRSAVQNHGGGHLNHSLFWLSLNRPKNSAPKAQLAASINRSFGSFSKCQDQLRASAASVFGSGWAWLALHPSGQLSIDPYPNQNSPLSRGLTPILGIDVWEHAYYLQYQNRRPDYLSAILKVIDWDAVSAHFEQSLKSAKNA